MKKYLLALFLAVNVSAADVSLNSGDSKMIEVPEGETLTINWSFPGAVYCNTRWTSWSAGPATGGETIAPEAQTYEVACWMGWLAVESASVRVIMMPAIEPPTDPPPVFPRCTTLLWDAPTHDIAGNLIDDGPLSHQIFIGTEPGNYVQMYGSDKPEIKLSLPQDTYYWAVASIRDTGEASPLSEEHSFTL